MDSSTGKASTTRAETGIRSNPYTSCGTHRGSSTATCHGKLPRSSDSFDNSCSEALRCAISIVFVFLRVKVLFDYDETVKEVASVAAQLGFMVVRGDEVRIIMLPAMRWDGWLFNDNRNGRARLAYQWQTLAEDVEHAAN